MDRMSGDRARSRMSGGRAVVLDGAGPGRDVDAARAVGNCTGDWEACRRDQCRLGGHYGPADDFGSTCRQSCACPAARV